MLRASIPTTVSIRVDAKSESDFILADPVQIQQVVMNLCTNTRMRCGRKEEPLMRRLRLLCPPLCREPSRDRARSLREADRAGYRNGYPDRHYRQNIRSFFHHENAWRGHRPRSLRCRRDVKSTTGISRLKVNRVRDRPFVYLPRVAEVAPAGSATEDAVPAGPKGCSR